MAVHVSASWRRSALLCAGVVLLHGACADSDTNDGETAPAVTEEISGDVLPGSVGDLAERSATELDAPDDSSVGDVAPEGTPVADEVDEPPRELATPAPGLRRRFERLEDGGEVDPCGLAGGRPAVAESPPAFFGLSRSYGDDSVEYRAGAAASWCVYDFEVGPVITVRITAPDGSEVINEVVLDDDSSVCALDCPLDQSLIVAGPAFNTAALVAEARVGDRVDGVVGAWIPAEARIGRYRVVARQVPTTGESIVSRSEFEVVRSDVAGVSMASSRTEPGAPEVGYVVGHDPRSSVPLGLYAAMQCGAGECADGVGAEWRFVEMLGDVAVDRRGAATFDLDPLRWEPGTYCVVSPATVPGRGASSGGADPCSSSGVFPAGFDRDWAAVDSGQRRQVVVGGPTIGVDLSPSGTRVATSDAGTMTVRDTDGNVLASVPREGAELPEFMQEGDRIVSYGPDGVEIWDPASGVRRLVVSGEVQSPVLVEGGDLLIGHQDSAIRQWDLESGESEVVLNFTEVLTIDVNDDRTGIVVSTSLNVYSWDFESVELVQMLAPGTAQLEINSRGHEVLMIVDGAVTIRGMDGAVLLTLPIEGVEMARLSPDGESIATVSTDGVTIWNREGGSIGQIPRVGIEQITHIEFGPEADTLLIAGDHGVLLHQI